MAPASLPVPRHDDSKDRFRPPNLPLRRVRYFNSLFIKSRVGGFVFGIDMFSVMYVPCSGLWTGRASVNRAPKVDA